MAIVITPPRTTNFDPVPECKPTISPSVVMTADVKPNVIPVRNESFICMSSSFQASNILAICGVLIQFPALAILQKEAPPT